MTFDYFRGETFLRFCLKPVVFIAALFPVVLLSYGIYFESLGADVAKYIMHKTGDWALRFLWLTLSISPLNRWLGWPQLLRLRRMLGLFCFFYATLHFATYYGLYLFFDFSNAIEDVSERPFITVGFLAICFLLPLAMTSTQKWRRRLGRNWLALHRLVYVIALLVWIHFVWLVKSDLNEPLIYGILLSLLLGVRLYWKASARISRRT